MSWRRSAPDGGRRIEGDAPELDVVAVHQPDRELRAWRRRCRRGRRTGSPSRGDTVGAEPGGGAFTKRTSGPKVMSSSFWAKLPACSGPETNSQNGIEVLEPRLRRVVVVRGGVVHVRGQPDGVGDAGGLDVREQVGELELAAARRGRRRRWRPPRRRGRRRRPPRTPGRSACRRR